MNTIKSCPDCSNNLSPSINRCACGWSDLNKKQHIATDYRCHFYDGDKRCEELGRMSHSRRGQWYCSDHYHEVRNNRLLMIEKKIQNSSSFLEIKIVNNK